MSATTPPRHLEAYFAEAARRYLAQLPLEHFMEATPQATQRRITLGSLELLEAGRDDFHLYNELLVQKPRPDGGLCQVVPDNVVVLHEGPLEAGGSYDVTLQPAEPFWVLEYVSKRSARKDYEDSFAKYERELRVPYYLIFYPDNQELTLYRHDGTRYVSVPPDGRGRHPIPQLELEVGLLDGWVRYWVRGELLPLPAELLALLEKERSEREKERRELEKRLEEQRRELEKEQQDWQKERLVLEKRMEEERKARQEEREKERKERLAMEQELERLRARPRPSDEAP